MKRVPWFLMMSLTTLLQAAPIQWKGSRDDEGRRTAICVLPHAKGTPIALTGKILQVDPLETLRDDKTCIHFLLQTEADIIEVHVGTFGNLKKRHVELAPGDAVTVEGSRLELKMGSHMVVLAKTLTWNGKTIQIEWK